MALLRDWLDLGKNTVNSLKTNDVTNLYSLEWPETQKMLVAEHRASIEAEPKRLMRWIRTVSAIFYGWVSGTSRRRAESSEGRS